MCYRSLNSTEEYNDLLNDQSREVKKLNHSYFCIMGDFNHKEIKWNQYCVEGPENSQEVKFFYVTQDLYLFQHVCDVTRVMTGHRPSNIDLVFTNEQFMADEVKIYSALGKSDHATLFWILYLANEVKKVVTEGLSVNLNFRLADITSISKHF